MAYTGKRKVGKAQVKRITTHHYQAVPYKRTVGKAQVKRITKHHYQAVPYNITG